MRPALGATFRSMSVLFLWFHRAARVVPPPIFHGSNLASVFISVLSGAAIRLHRLRAGSGRIIVCGSFPLGASDHPPVIGERLPRHQVSVLRPRVQGSDPVAYRRFRPPRRPRQHSHRVRLFGPRSPPVGDLGFAQPASQYRFLARCRCRRSDRVVELRCCRFGLPAAAPAAEDEADGRRVPSAVRPRPLSRQELRVAVVRQRVAERFERRVRARLAVGISVHDDEPGVFGSLHGRCYPLVNLSWTSCRTSPAASRAEPRP